MNVFDDFEVISSYSRAEALKDGFLVDVTDWASNDKGFLGGFTVSVALTSALYSTLEEIPEDSNQDLRGRAQDVLFIASLALRLARKNLQSDSKFSVFLATKQNAQSKLDLYVIASLGDEGEPVVTIGYPEDF